MASGGTHKHPAKLEFAGLGAVVQDRVSRVCRHRGNTKPEVEEGSQEASVCSAWSWTEGPAAKRAQSSWCSCHED